MIIFDNDLPIIFTAHARKRIEMFGLTIYEAVLLVRNGFLEKIPKEMRRYKKRKYNDPEVFYWRSDRYIFTAKHIIDKKTNKPAFLVITVTDQLINVPHSPFQDMLKDFKR